jgi:hypothetical protein
VEDIHDQETSIAIGRRWRQAALPVIGTTLFSQARRNSATHSELPFQAGRKVVRVLARPGAHFAAKQAYNSLFDRMFSWFPGMLISD